ncbi:nitronate monooxygenase [Cryomorpha ignava]|uniref:Nitronate monooxygenase n=1 Tax=Cryomorpha ignava TaxID=101383 RepID=A0A7K3WQT1_9FLAO|nr:nitronate monooxygenase [Cryomorpha ignava]NEN24039.1 nitronate monooxygenase [Cryomorpha ignava]
MNSITALLDIKYPVIQAGMVWCSGWKLASACSENGILGVIGSGSMYSEVLDIHIKKYLAACNKPFAVNLPLLYPDIGEHLETIFKHKVPVVITSAGSPAKYTEVLKSRGIKVIQAVSSAKFAAKAQNAGVDAVICEGFEAGGHNGREETTSFCLIPEVRRAVSIPVIAAGGIATGRGILAAIVLGADGVQIGTRFATAVESSAHKIYKERVVAAKEGDTVLTLKELAPVRLIKNAFYDKVIDGYKNGFSPAELSDLLGKGRAKKGIFEGDLEEGELEIGQVASLIDKIESSEEIINDLVKEYNQAVNQTSNLRWT